MAQKHNYDAMISWSKDRSELKKAQVMEAIASAIRNGEQITISSIAKKAGCSRQFIRNNEELMEFIRQAQNNASRRQRTETVEAHEEDKAAAYKALWEGLKKENAELKRIIEAIVENPSSAEVYEREKRFLDAELEIKKLRAENQKLLAKIAELQEQIEAIYGQEL